MKQHYSISTSTKQTPSSQRIESYLDHHLTLLELYNFYHILRKLSLGYRNWVGGESVPESSTSASSGCRPSRQAEPSH